jgi:hypothetical protein
MLSEIEETLVKTLKEKLTDLPPENITVYAQPRNLPAVVISNLKFKFKNAGIIENMEQKKTELETTLSGDGATKVFKLDEPPLRNSVAVESPLGVKVSERTDYVVNYENGAIIFLEAPIKGKDNIHIKYTSKQSMMTLKAMRVKALYAISVLSANRARTDELAEKVVKALLAVEDDLLAEGIEIRSLGGSLSQDDEKTEKITLKYILEKEMRLEQVVSAMEKIEIKRKSVSVG